MLPLVWRAHLVVSTWLEVNSAARAMIEAAGYELVMVPAEPDIQPPPALAVSLGVPA